jgi:anti-anti-sigma regulatory factor
MIGNRERDRPHQDQQRRQAYVMATIAACLAVVMGIALGALFFAQQSLLGAWGQAIVYAVGIMLALILLLAMGVTWWAARGLNAGLATAQAHIEALAQVDQEGAQVVAELERRAAEQARLNRLVAMLSAPLIPVGEQIVIIPLVGTIDQERIQHIRDSLLQRIEQQRARVALVDLTGVASIAHETMELFTQLISAVELMGCRVVLTGISTPIARSFLEHGIELPAETHRDVKAGLAQAMELFSQAGGHG